jgi:hypothetical protein
MSYSPFPLTSIPCVTTCRLRTAVAVPSGSSAAVNVRS